MTDPMTLLLDPIRIAGLALIPAWVYGVRAWHYWRSREARRVIAGRLAAIERGRS